MKSTKLFVALLRVFAAKIVISDEEVKPEIKKNSFPGKRNVIFVIYMIVIYFLFFFAIRNKHENERDRKS